jgi:hypothetical protein
LNGIFTVYKFYYSFTKLALICSVLLLAACGGGGSSGAVPSGSSPATAAVPALAFTAVKVFQFTWTDVTEATHYRLLENPDGVSGFTQVGADISSSVEVYDHVVPLYARVNAQYILQSCNATGCIDSTTVTVAGTLVASIGYVKASNTGANDQIGTSVALSGDTLAVGAFGEDSNGIGVNSAAEGDNSDSESGAVYVFTRSAGAWSQQAYIKASNTGAGDQFGYSIALFGDTLAVGANAEDSNGIGVNSAAEGDNSATNSGAVYVFTRSAGAWSQQAYVKASNTGANDQFGTQVALSGDTLAVAAWAEDSNGIGVNSATEGDNSAINSGAVYVFSRSAGVWSQQAYIKASNTGADDQFGARVALSGDTLAVGAFAEDSNGIGVNSAAEGDNSSSSSGATYIF